MKRPLPMVACSPVTACGCRGASTGAGCGVARGGSGVGVEVTGPVWLGFHIALKTCSFSVPAGDWGDCQGKASGVIREKSKSADRRLSCLRPTRQRPQNECNSNPCRHQNGALGLFYGISRYASILRKFLASRVRLWAQRTGFVILSEIAVLDRVMGRVMDRVKVLPPPAECAE